MQGWQSRQSLLVDQAAEVLNVSRRTIYHLVRCGKLEGLKVYGSSRVTTKSVLEEKRRRDDRRQ